MVALGVGQTLGSFVGSMTVTASFGRSAVNCASGVRTTFGGIVTGLIIIASCAFLTPYLAYIPTAALSAVIIAAMIFTIDVDILLPMWRSKKLDFIPYTVTLLLSIFIRIEVGLIVGVLTHLTILVYSASSPEFHVAECRVDNNVDYLLISPDRGLFFPAVDAIRKFLTSSSAVTKPVIVDMSRVVDMDFTAASVS